MRKLRILFTCLLMASISLVSAQTKTASGTVISVEDGQPIIGAKVVVKGSKSGAATNADGQFSFTVPSGSTLVISYLGMKEQEVSAGQNLIVKLENDEKTLNEILVVSTALGIKRQQKEVGYAATTIKDNFIKQANATNVQQALVGKISGLNITTTNSGVFENAKVNIRGIRSLTGNNQPLLVLDGAIVDLSYLSSLSPEDIQDITVLKSGASASLYGPEAVNGVILVTTKKGNSDKTRVSISSSVQVNRVAYFPKMQKDFGPGAGETQDQYGNYLYVPYENQQYGPKFDGSIKNIGIKLQDGSILSGPYNNAHYNDRINFWNNGTTFQNSISLTGKNYFLSLTNADIKGLIPGDKNRRTTVRFNSEKEYKKLNVSYNINYTNSQFDIFDQANMPNITQSSYTGGLMSQILQIPANVPLISTYKDLNSFWGQYENYFNEYAMNPYWLVANLREKGTSHDLLGNLDASYTFTKWLKANIKTSGTLNTSHNTNTLNAIAVSDWTLAHRDNTSYHNQPGTVMTSQTTSTRLNYDGFLSGDVDVTNALKLKYVLGSGIKSTLYQNVALGGNDLSVRGINNVAVRLGDAVVPTYSYNSTIRTRLVSVYGDITLGYNDYIWLELTGRNDWDSRLAVKNRSVFYPGASLSMLLTDMIPSLKTNTINYLKLRGAWSKSGNVNISAYSLIPAYSLGTGFPFGNFTGYTANNTFPSLDLKPEFVITSEVGFELRMLKDRINFETTLFNQQCNNQVLQVAQSWSTGYSTLLANAASFRNYGVELDLGLNPLVNLGRGNITLKMNATYNDNKVTSTLNNTKVVLYGTGNFIQQAASNPTVNEIAQIGLPAFQFQLTDYVRDPATGKVIIDPKTGNPSLANDLVTKGRSLPLWIVGITPAFNYESFSVSMTWEYKGGHNYYAGVGPDMDFSGISARSAQYDRQRFVFPNSVYLNPTTGKYVDNTNILVQDGNYGFWTGKTTNTGIGTNYFASASAWRLREVNISYTLPTRLIKSIGVISSATISLVGRNLLMFVPKSNQWGDPDFNYTSSGNTFGLSNAYGTPSSRYYGATLNVQF